MSEIDKIDELPEPDHPSAHDDSMEYAAGFEAGKAGIPSSDGMTVDWHRGWADART